MIPPTTYDCPICDQVCPSLAQYLSHYEKAHGRSSSTAAEPAKGRTINATTLTDVASYRSGCPILGDEEPKP